MLNTTLLAISATEPLDLGPLIWGIVMVLAVLGALVGFWRGFMRQTVRTITVVIAVIISYALVPYIYNAINGYIEEKTVAGLQTMLIDTGKLPEWIGASWVQSLDPHAAKLFLMIPISLFVMPVIFAVCFVIISSILLMLHRFICALCGFKSRRNSFSTRILGFILGLIQGAVIAGIIMMPIIGVGTMADESMKSVEEYSSDEASTQTFSDLYTAYAKSVGEHPMAKAYWSLGAKSLYSGVATVTLDGTEINMTGLFPDALLMAYDATKFGGIDPKELTPEEKERILTMLNRVEENPIISDIIASAVRSGSFAYRDGSFPVAPPEPFNTLILESLEIFHTSTAENLPADLKTLSDIYFAMSDGGVLSSFNDGSDAIIEAMNKKDAEGKTTANRIVDMAKSNERITPLVTALTKLSITAMQNGAGIGEDALASYESIKSGINSSVLSIDKNSYEIREDYVADLSTALDSTLKDNGIEIEKQIVDEMAVYVADNFSEVKEITDEVAIEIIFSYYDAYLKYKETGEIPEI